MESESKLGQSLEEVCKRLFLDSLHKISVEVNPGLEAKEESLLFIESLLVKLITLLFSVGPKTVPELEERVLKIFPTPIDRQSLRWTQNVLKKRSMPHLIFSSIVDPLQLQLGKVLSAVIAPGTTGGSKLDPLLALHLIAILEFITIDILRLTGNYVKNMRHTEIKSEDVKIAMHADKVLMDLFYEDEDEDDLFGDDWDEDVDDDDEVLNDRLDDREEAHHPHHHEKEHEREERTPVETTTTGEDESDICDNPYLDVIKDIVVEERKFVHQLNVIMRIYHRGVKGSFDPGPVPDLVTQSGALTESINNSKVPVDINREVLIDRVFSNVRDVHELAMNFLGLIEDSLEMNPETELMIGCCFEELLESQEFDVFERFSADVCGDKESFSNAVNALLYLIPNRGVAVSTASFPLLIKYVLPVQLKSAVLHSLHYYEYIKVLKSLTNNDEDREAFVQSEGLMRPLIKEIEKNLREEREDRERLLFLSKKRRKKEEARRKVKSLLQRIDGLDNKTKNLLINCELIMDGVLVKVRRSETSVVSLRKASTQFHSSSRVAFLFDSLLLLVKEEVGTTTGAGGLSTSSTASLSSSSSLMNNHQNSGPGDRGGSVSDEEILHFHPHSHHNHHFHHHHHHHHHQSHHSSLITGDFLGMSTCDELSEPLTPLAGQSSLILPSQASISNVHVMPITSYRFKEKFLIRKLEILENDQLGHCFEIRGGTSSSSLSSSSSTFLLAKNEEEKRRWFAAILLFSCKSSIERNLDLVLTEEEKRSPLRLPPVEEYIFSEPDSEENILFEPGSTTTIKGATLEKLIERLTYHSFADPMFVKIFLVTFRSFTDSHSLLDLLRKRFQIPLIGDSREEIKRYKKEFLEPVQFRVLNVIRHWIDLHYGDDFSENPQLTQDVEEFLCSIGNRNMKKWVESILKILRRRQAESEHRLQMTMANSDGTVSANGLLPESGKRKVITIMPRNPPPIEWYLTRDPSKLNLITIHPLEFGRQLTLYEFELYCAVRPFELIDLKWTKDSKEIDAPHLMRMIKHSNNFTYFLAKEILETPNFDERVALVSRVIEILQVLVDLNNFNGVLEIISALNLSCIYRLDHTLSALSYKSRKLIEEMQELNSDHYRKYQERLRSINPPCVPFFGIYLTNILHLEEGNPNIVQSNLINFSKRRKIAEITTEIQQYQNQPYCLNVCPEVRSFVIGMDPLQGGDQKHFEDYLYQKSLQIEPRGTSRPVKNGVRRWPCMSLKSPGIKPSSSSLSSSSSTASSILTAVCKPSSLSLGSGDSNPSPLVSPKTPPNSGLFSGDHSIFAKILIPTSANLTIAANSTSSGAGVTGAAALVTGANASTPPPLPPRTTNTLSRNHQRTMSESSIRNHQSPPMLSPSHQLHFSFSVPPPPPPRIKTSSTSSPSAATSQPPHGGAEPPPPLPPRGISPATRQIRQQPPLTNVPANSGVPATTNFPPPPRRNSSSLSPPPFPPALIRRQSTQPSLPPRTYRSK